jgi:ribosome-associated protein
MEDTSSINTRETALALARVVEKHGGLKIIVLDLSSLAVWTDYFVIATVTSTAHMRGVIKFVKDFLDEKGVETYRRSSTREDEEWLLVDCGDFVLHLMNQRTRDFYELEKLWFQAESIQI